MKASPGGKLTEREGGKTETLGWRGGGMEGWRGGGMGKAGGKEECEANGFIVTMIIRFAENHFISH